MDSVTLSAILNVLGKIDGSLREIGGGSDGIGDEDWTGAVLAVAHGGTGASTASGARTNLGLAIGTDVQAFDELLGEIAALSTDPNADSGLFFDDSAGAVAYWTPAGNLSFSGTTLTDSANPQFTTIELGHASDTTLARSGAGDVTVEGKAVYRADGTDVALADGGTGASLADPGGDRLMFWDDSAGAVTWLTLGTGLTITDTTIDASGSGGFESGTLMLFQQTAAPTGWTKDTTHNDKALRVVSGTASSGGTNSFSTTFASINTGSTTLTTAQLASHTHNAGGSNNKTVESGGSGSAQRSTQTTSNATSSAGSGDSHNHTVDLRVQYVDLIIASKD